MGEMGLEEIGVHIKKRQNTVAQYIATQTIMELCERSFQRPSAWVSWRWWDQDGIELWRARERAAAASDREREKRREELAQEKTSGRS